MKPYVMTILGDDRPGLVKTVSELIASSGGDWMESKLSRLGNSFAGILRFRMSEDAVENLENAMKALAGKGLISHLKEDAEGAGSDGSPGTSFAFNFQLYCPNRPGILSEITGVLRDHAANLTDVRTRCEIAPMSGDTLFQAVLVFEMDNLGAFSGLKEQLENTAVALGGEIEWSPR